MRKAEERKEDRRNKRRKLWTIRSRRAGQLVFLTVTNIQLFVLYIKRQ